LARGLIRQRTAPSGSDYDIAIILRGKRGDFVGAKLEMTDLAYDALREEGFYIQALPVWEDKFLRPASYSNSQRLENIEREGVLL
jgi:hypothetical protein